MFAKFLESYWKVVSNKRAHRIALYTELSFLAIGIGALILAIFAPALAHTCLAGACFSVILGNVVQITRRHYGKIINYNAVGAVFLGEEYSKFYY